jgi:ERCC4-type nuclease
LLKAFGGIGGVRNADEQALISVKGISKRDARNILDYFNK